MSEAVTKKKSKKWIIFVIIAVVMIAIIATGAVFVSRAVKINRSTKELSLGNKYLDELEYEEAIAHYLAAIEINPANLDAYVGIYEAYDALADLAIEDHDYSQAYEYYSAAYDILKDGRNYITSDKLDEMVEDMKNKKKDAKNKRDGIVDDTDDTDDDSLNDSDSDEEKDYIYSEDYYDELLANALVIDSTSMTRLLSAMAERNACEYRNVGNYTTVPSVISGDTLAMAKWILPTSERGAAYDYSIDWTVTYNWDDSNYWYTGIALDDANQAAYSICGKHIDFSTYDWQSAGYIGIENYNGVECLTVKGGYAGWVGAVMDARSIESVEYCGNYVWKVVFEVWEVSSVYDGMAYETEYCEAALYLEANPDSSLMFSVIDCSIENVNDTGWVDKYYEFLLQYRDSISGGLYSEYATYDMVYIDDDNIPELIIMAGGEYSYYVYTIKNGAVEPYNCSNASGWNNESNYLFVASGVGGTSGSIEYIPYTGKILISHSDADYAGEVYYTYDEYFDGSMWYGVGEGMFFYRDENGNVGPNVQNDIDNGWISSEEYNYTYDAPGYDPDAEWVYLDAGYKLSDLY